jgi:hypothetical protein
MLVMLLAGWIAIVWYTPPEKDAPCSPKLSESDDLTNTICLIVFVLLDVAFVLEFSLRSIAHGVWHTQGYFQLYPSHALWGITIVLDYLIFFCLLDEPPFRDFRCFRLLRLIGSFQTLRALETIVAVTGSFVVGGKVLLGILTLWVSSLYIFSVAGTFLFGNIVVECENEANLSSFCNELQFVGFQTIRSSMLALFLIVCQDGWVAPLMEPILSQDGWDSWIGIVYFVLAVAFLVWVNTNLIIAVITSSFINLRERQALQASFDRYHNKVMIRKKKKLALLYKHQFRPLKKFRVAVKGIMFLNIISHRRLNKARKVNWFVTLVVKIHSHDYFMHFLMAVVCLDAFIQARYFIDYPLMEGWLLLSISICFIFEAIVFAGRKDHLSVKKANLMSSLNLLLAVIVLVCDTINVVIVSTTLDSPIPESAMAVFSAFRSFRVLRFLEFALKWRTFATLVDAIERSSVTIANFVFIVFIFIAWCSLLFRQLYLGIKFGDDGSFTGFDTFGTSVLTLFSLLSADGCVTCACSYLPLQLPGLL